jgi:hypothetical protein
LIDVAGGEFLATIRCAVSSQESANGRPLDAGLLRIKAMQFQLEEVKENEDDF